jgi:hypothetical protein
MLFRMSVEHIVAVVEEVDAEKKAAEEEKALRPVKQIEEPVVREQWSKKMDFLMSIIGFSVDLAGIWRL